MRRDARRNRERLVTEAFSAFVESGLDASSAMIAKRAGVGVGTLYRHFPTREALVDAAYRHELARLRDLASELLLTHTAVEAIRLWIGHFLDHASKKRGMSEALNAVIASGSDLFTDSRRILTDAVGALMAAGAEDGTLREGIGSDDVLLALSGFAQSTGDYGSREQADRLADLLLVGLSTRGPDQG
ncbi:TetR/AcrR family transcriptional regulator [Streptomyces cucumeris]|uniref:TetR/AcrR family transcriptional regulator n=1 Tax=Streptomyces cucumeris TaxID=2962890 RepID=UPI003D754717